MAVQYVKEKSRRKAKRENGIYSATRVFQAKAQVGDSEVTIGNHASIPNEGAQHDVITTAYCTSVDIAQQDNGVEWIVTCSYSSERELAEDPTEDPTRISWNGEIYTEAIDKDINGDAIVNSAGDYFVDPTPTKERTHRIARIVSNVASVPSWVIDFGDAVNDSDIVIDGVTITEGNALIKRIDISERKFRNGTEYREVSFDVHIHKDGWHLKPLDAGFREKSGTDRVQAKNSGADEEPTTPIPLDGSGNVLANPTPSTVVFLDFEIYDPEDFTTLPGIEAVP